jgi:hypothetical protein
MNAHFAIALRPHLRESSNLPRANCNPFGKLWQNLRVDQNDSPVLKPVVGRGQRSVRNRQFKTSCSDFR